MTIMIKCDTCGKTQDIPINNWKFNYPDGWQQFALDIIKEHKTVIYHYCPDCFKRVRGIDNL